MPFYKVDSSKIAGGAGRLVVRPFDGTYPEGIDEVIDLTEPYGLKEGWRDIGSTTDGITMTRGFDTEDFEVDQLSTPVDTDITSWTHSLETTLAENSMENRQLALGAGEIEETPTEYGTETTTTGLIGNGATIVAVTSTEGFADMQHFELGGKIYPVSSITSQSIVTSTPIQEAIQPGASVRPVTRLGTRRIGYGSVTDLPFYTFAILSKKKDGTIYMAVFRKCKISGDDKDQAFSKDEKRQLPLSLSAFSVDDVNISENVYYEIEQVL